MTFAEAMAEKREADGKATILVTNQACFGCTHACGRILSARWTRATSTIQNQPQYWGASGGL